MENLILGEGLLCDSVVVAEQMGSEILISDFGEQSCLKDEELVVHNVGESSVPDRSPGFYRDDNAGCVNSDEVNESGSVERDGLVGGDDNVSVLEGEECLNSEYGIGGCGVGGCSNRESSEMKFSEMKLKEGWCRGEDGFDPGNGVQQDELRDDLSADPSLSSEGVVNVKEEQGNFPSEVVDMDACGDYSVFSVNSLEAVSVKGVVLTGIEAAAFSNRISPAQDGEMSLEVAPQSVSPGNGIQRDEQRDDLSVDRLSSEGVMDVKEDMVDYSVFSVHSLEAASEKAVVLTGIETAVLSNRISLAHDVEMFPEVVPTGDMVSNCNWKNEHIDDNGVGRLKDLCNGKTTKDFDTFDQILLRREKQDFGKTFEDLPMSASPSSSAQLNDLRSNNIIDCSLVDRATEFIEEKSNVMADVQAEIDTRISTIGFNVSYLKEGSSDVAANCIIENSISLQSCDAFSIFNNSADGVFADSVPEVVELKGNIDLCNQTFPPEEKHTRDFEGLYVSDSPSVCTLENDQKSVELIGFPASETVNECLEQKVDYTNVEIGTQIVLKEDKSSNLNEGSSGLSPHNTIEESVSLQLYQPLDNGINGSSKRVDVQDTNDSPGHVESSTLYDHCGQMDHEGNDSFGVDCVYHTKFSTIIALSAQRSGRSHKTQTKKSPRKRRNTSKVLQPLAESVFKSAGRKRSCLSKPPRSSTWGLLGSVTQSFEESNGLEVFQVFQDQKEGSQKRRGSRRGEKQIHNGEIVNSQVSRGTKSNPLRLKVKFGKEVDKSSLCINVPEVVNTSASANSVQELNVIEGNWRQEATIKKCQPTSKIPFQDGELAKKDVGGVFVTENSAENEIEIGHGVTSLATAASSGGSAGSSYRDPGTSPDSEVINLVPEAHLEAKPQEDSHDTVLASDRVMSALVDLTSSKREKKKHKSPYSGNCVQEDGSPRLMKAEPSTNQDGCRQNVRLFSSETFTQLPGAKAVSNSSSDAEFSVEPLCLSEETDIIISKEALKVERGPEAETDCNLDVGLSSSKSPTFKNMLPSSKKKGQKLPKGKSRASDSASKRSNARKPRENNQKSLSKKKVKDDKQLACKVENPHDSGNPLVDGVVNGNSAHDAVLNLDVVPADIDKQYLPPRQAWVLCDACNKWRQIPAELADYIDETKCTWTCGLNEDLNFADCLIPQEKSNAEINAELEISDASGEEDASDRQLHYKTLEYRRPSVSQQHVSSIKTNQFLHRNRKNQSIDEIMVCHCKPPSNGKLGCGDDCLNRMLNIECVRGTCPCGDLCSNQQFQKRRYAKLEKFPSGKKGFGLRSLDHIFEGQFLIEYVGEVLDTHAYEARLKEYAVKGHRHFYFMTLNTSEVIDACAKGNLGRFINHSCDPNCRTEKWMVNGEVCIGLFALRDIKKGEEVTFDYNFVRVIGAAAKKCHCGSPHCQGFIGGDPLNTEVTIQDDSDEEYVEPVMIPEDGLSEDSKSNMGLGDGFDDSGIVKHEEIVSTNKELDKSIISVGDLETTTQIEESDNQYTLELEHLKPPSSAQPVEAFGEKETISEKSSNSFERQEITSPKKISIPISDGVDAKKQFKVDTIHRNVKTSRLSSSVKKGKVRSTFLSTNKIQVVANKAHVLPFKPKRLIEGSVEEKLNELLDVDGGISKRKDSTKGYLKLLFLTAQSGDSGSGEAIKSNRDLSIILDALVKTKSRAVLVDIINKNGLRMLHNIMKMCRRDFNKIPILRKLLKVLEYLAERPQILTQEHITGGPPCPGMESFTESILSLTEHDDKTVHQIARNFRNRWIPRAFRRQNFVDRDDRNRGSNYNRFSTSHDNWHDQSGRSTEVAECVKQSGVNTPPSASTGLQEGSSTPSAGSCPSSVTKVRKRKSRWDQPAETISDPISLPNKEQKMEPGLNTQLESNVLPQAGDVTLHPEANLAFDGKQNNLEDVPPGFSSCLNTPVVSSVASSPSSVMGSPQAKFVSRLPVSYGIPLSIVQQYGTAHAETADTWVVAPGMPFRPFPPLPPGPRPKEDASHSHDVNLMSVNHGSEGQQASFVPGNCQSEESTRSTTSATQVDFDMASANNDLCSKRQREFSYESPMGRRYFKQQKWNHPKPRPPWIRDRNGWGCNGNNFRGGTNSIGVGNVPNELRTPAGNNVDQHSQHH